MAVAAICILVSGPAASGDSLSWVAESPLGSYAVTPDSVVYDSTAGRYPVTAPFRAVHDSRGGGRGALGYPTTAPITDAGPYRYQQFKGGVIYDSPHGTHATTGGARTVHASRGGGTGALGYPTSGAIQEGARHTYQAFERGVIYTSPRGTWAVDNGALRNAHQRLGGGGGAIGYPTAAYVQEAPRYGYQTFERAIVYTGPQGAYAVPTAVEAAHRNSGGGGGLLGYPISDTYQRAGVTQQRFERGTIDTAILPRKASSDQWVRTPRAYPDVLRQKFDTYLTQYGCGGTEVTFAPNGLGKAAALAFPWWGTISLTAIPDYYLPYVAAHECAHLLQQWNTGGDWEAARNRLNAIYGGVGNAGVEANADCIAARLGQPTGTYTKDCSGVRGAAADAVLQGRMP